MYRLWWQWFRSLLGCKMLRLEMRAEQPEGPEWVKFTVENWPRLLRVYRYYRGLGFHF